MSFLFMSFHRFVPFTKGVPKTVGAPPNARWEADQRGIRSARRAHAWDDQMSTLEESNKGGVKKISYPLHGNHRTTWHNNDLGVEMLTRIQDRGHLLATIGV
jgi:hypothetical protein